MNNHQNNVNRGLLDTSRSNTGNQYQNYVNNAGNQLSTDQNNANDLRGQIQSSYTDNNNFMPSGLTPNANGWFDLSGGGANGSGSTSSSGFGMGPAAGGDYSQAKSGYSSMASGGGQDTFQPALDSYKNFMSNGGLGATTEDNMRYRATSMVPAFYDKYKSELQRRSNVQGGYSPGYDDQMAAIGRDAGRAGYDASRNAEADIADKELQGKEFGTTGYANVAGNINANKLSGLGGLKGIGDSEQQNSQFNAGLGQEVASRNQAMQQFLMNQYSSGKQANTQGLQTLRSSSDGTLNNSNNNFLGGLNGMSQSDLANLGMRLGIKDQNWMNLIPGLVGAGGAIASGFGGSGQRPS
jgi:hypothetical protein